MEGRSTARSTGDERGARPAAWDYYADFHHRDHGEHGEWQDTGLDGTYRQERQARQDDIRQQRHDLPEPGSFPPFLALLASLAVEDVVSVVRI